MKNICICCKKWLPAIKEDGSYGLWSRTMHKKCYKETSMYMGLLAKYKNQFGDESKTEVIEYYSKLAGLKNR